MSTTNNTQFLSPNDRVECARVARDEYIKDLKETYAKNAERLRGRRYRFVKNNPEEILKVAAITGSGVLCGATVGGVMGAIIGGACGTPGGPPGMAAGAIIGVPVGAGIGAAVGMAVSGVRIYPEYKKWLKTEHGRKFGQELLTVLISDETLEPYLCGISRVPTVDAVRTPQGQLYERCEIEKWIKKNGTDPLTRAPLTVDQLVDDNSSTLETSKKFLELLSKAKSKVETASPEFQKGIESVDPQFLKGIDALAHDIQQGNNQRFNNQLIALQKRHSDLEISAEEYRIQFKELTEMYA